MQCVVAEVTRLVYLFQDISIPIPLFICLYLDSQSFIHIAKNPVFHEKTKHVEIDCYFAWQKFFNGLISISFVRSLSQLADFFMKSLTGPLHHNILGKLGALSSLQAWGRVLSFENNEPTGMIKVKGYICLGLGMIGLICIRLLLLDSISSQVH